ncbi:MAG: hypothetical protein J1F33_07335 [Clostridiales bacterium]|nr:hypothetical protein [Clostridiales bacterium]
MPKTVIIIIAFALIVLVVLIAVGGIMFIRALRKRTPVVKVLMTAKTKSEAQEIDDSPEETATDGAPVVPEPEEDDDDEEAETFVTEGQERVSYNRSITAKLCQLPNEAKDWYSELKNELLSYQNVKLRPSWKRESYRLGRATLARIVVRGKTLCLMLAVEPAGYNGTKYTVEDVSGVASTSDTPTMYRIKSVRRLQYAKEMIAGMMKELKAYKDPHYELKDFFMPYEGDMSLMQRGLVKRVVSGTATRTTLRIEEVDRAEQEAAAEGETNADAQ